MPAHSAQEKAADLLAFNYTTHLEEDIKQPRIFMLRQ